MINPLMGLVWLSTALFVTEWKSFAFYSCLIIANVWFATGSLLNNTTK